MLQNVVEAAATLLDARYAALGVIGEDDRLSEFVHTGFDGDAEMDCQQPEGRGILGLLIREARPIRLRDLVVPIVVHDKVYGRLYITEKGGGGQFVESDEELALALAAMAASTWSQ